MTLHDSPRSVRFAPLPDTHRPQRSSFPLESYPPCPPPLPRRRNIFRPPFFKRQSSSGSDSPSSSTSLTPTTSLDITPEDIFTLGTLNLFRSARNPKTNPRPVVHDPPATWYHPSPSRSFVSAGDNNRGSKRHFFSNSSSNQRKAVKMLNGRVYGAPPDNPFANISSEPDPEFVEWGYGGMGSVRGRHAAGMSGTRWERLHNNDDDPSMDDGSGMQWVRKRREARAAREADKSKSANEPTESPTQVKTPDDQICRSPDPTEDVSQSNLEHVLHAITIPADFQRHHHHHRSNSKTGLLGPGGEKEADHHPTTIREVENHASDESSESEGSDEEDPEEDESEDDEPERRTAIGAGVEKYTRHNDAPH